MIWWALVVVAVGALIAYARKGPNAVWGTATLAVIVGVVVAFLQPAFDWWIIGKALVIGAAVGLAFEALPLLTRRR